MPLGCVAGYCRSGSFVVFALLSLGADALAQSSASADALLAIDQQRTSVVERIVAAWGPTLAKSNASVSIDELRTRLMSLRADQLFAASLAGTEDGLREVTGFATAEPSMAPLAHTKALGDTASDVVYTPVTPCRLVETRGTFAAVYQGNGTASHTPVPFASNEIRTYAVQGGNAVCLTQLPASLAPSAVQLQVFGIPTTAASGDVEILPQGATFGSTATMVYVASLNFNTVSTAAKINTANKQISVQVRGGGAHLAIDVVGYFAAPAGNGGKFFRQGGNAFGTTASLGTTDSQALSLMANGLPIATYLPNATSPNIVSGHPNNAVDPSRSGQTIAGGGKDGTCYNPMTNSYDISCANQTSDDSTTIGGGSGNRASGFSATISGGYSNTATGIQSTVAGGNGNLASANGATVAGGSFNIASGIGTFAAGFNAHADRDGCAIFGLWLGSVPMNCIGASSIFRVGAKHGFSVEYFSQRADGGGNRWLHIGDLFANQTIATWTGAFLSDGGVWTNASDRNLKENFAPVDARDILARVAALPVMQWNYRSEPGVRRIGPVAQDFHAEFGLGSNDTTIATGDESGVALAAIQGLHQLMREKDAKIEAQQRDIEMLRGEMEVVERALRQLTPRFGP